MPHQPTPQSQSPLLPVDCLLAALLGVMLPFYLTAAGGDPEIAHAAIIELINACDAATPAELDIAGRSLGFGSAAMDNLRLSMRPGLSDRKILQYRANAVALGRMAEQSRKVLEAMQSKREQQAQSAGMPHPPPMPSPKPPPVARPRPSEPPPSMPPARPQGSANPVSAVEGDPEFATDIDTMRRNTRAMLADLEMMMKLGEAGAPATPGEQTGLPQSHAARQQ